MVHSATGHATMRPLAASGENTYAPDELTVRYPAS